MKLSRDLSEFIALCIAHSVRFLIVGGVDFDACWRRRMMIPVDDEPVPLIGASDLINNKEASGRPQDTADAAVLRAFTT